MDFVQNWVLYRTCLWGYNTKRLVQAKSNDSYAHSITMGRTTECSPDVWRYWCIRQEYRKGAELGDQAWELENQRFSSDHCRKCARRLLNNGTLREAFDPVLEVPGLRDGMRISTLNKLFGTRCYEEAANYLAHIVTTYSRLVESRESMVKLAAEDVKALELKCPKFCRRDAEEIRSAMNRGEIFRSFSKMEQERILKEAASLDYIIPSLRTFFQDIYLLDDCATSIKYLLKPGRTTVRAALERNFSVQRCQQSQPAQGLAPHRAFDDAIRALWIFALSNFLKLPKPSARKDNRLLAKTLSEEASQGTVQTFARLAQSLGFWSREIEVLTHVRPGSELNGGPDVDGSFMGQIDRLEHPDVITTMLLLNFTGDKRQLHRRCGRPRYETYHQCRTFLNKAFLHYDYGKLSIDGLDIAPFLILRSQYLAFFNIPGHVCQRHESNPPEIDETVLELIAVPPALEQNNLESREDTASQYTDITVESIDDKRRGSEERSTVALRVTRSEVPNDHIQIAFKTFKEGKFVTVAQVDAGQPRDVLNAATTLMRVEGMKHFSVALEPITVDQCLQSARDCGLNTIIVLPANNFEISAEIRRAAGQLRAN